MPIIQADYKTTLSTNLSSVATTFNVASPPDLTEGCLCINRGQDTEEWVYMSSVAADTITVSHRGLSKTSGTLTEVAGNKNQHFAGETVEWVNHPVHIINKRGDTVYGNLLLDGTSEIQFGTDATNIKDNAGSLELEDASGTIALSDIASTSTKLDDFAACDDNTDLNADTARHGLMQKYPGGTSAFLREDGNWATPSGAGNVSTSDSSATDNAIVREDGTGGTTIQKSLATIDDSGSINIPSGETYNINGTALSKGDVGLGNVTNNAQIKKLSTSVNNELLKWDGVSGDTVQNSGISVVSGRISGTEILSGDGSNNCRLGEGSSVASSYGSTAIGVNATVSDDYSIAIGYYSEATRYGEFCISGDNNSLLNGGQVFYTGVTSNTTTPTEIFIRGESNKRLTIKSHSCMVFEVVVAVYSSDNSSAVYKLSGGIKRDSLNNTSLIGTVTTDFVKKDAGLSGIDVSVTADDTNEALIITVTGVTGSAQRWGAKVNFTEVGNS